MRRALFVGINDYPFGALNGCVADAEALASLLARNEDNSRNFDVRLMTGPPSQLSRADLRQAITELFQQPAEVAVFYFSGHGSENDLGGYLVTPDATTYDEGVPMADVIQLANKSSVTEAIIIVDCCHSGHLGNLPLGPREANPIAQIREGVSILTASRSTEPAIESGGRGVFTTLVCLALDGGAADVQGRTNVAGLFAYVEESLGPWQQRPLFKSHVSSLLCLRQVEPAVSLVELQRLTEFFAQADSEFQLDPSYEHSHAEATQVHVTDYQVLVAYRNARLIEVATHDHLYYAAVEGGTVRLTPLGRHYWSLVHEGRL
ncbi:MAG TPA: caspase family protein [Dehalococcoidia bacterium]